MVRLQDAQARLERALDRLEKAAAAPRGGGGDADALRRELAAARKRCAGLEDRTREVSQRLDDAIGRIKALLDA